MQAVTAGEQTEVTPDTIKASLGAELTAAASTPIYDRGPRAWHTVAGDSVAAVGRCDCTGIFQACYEENPLREYSSLTVACITSMDCKSSSTDAIVGITDDLGRLHHAWTLARRGQTFRHP